MFLYTVALLIALCACCVSGARVPDAHHRVSISNADYLYQKILDLVEPDGYDVQQHFVTTEDGYILRVYRIPNGRPGTRGAPVANDSMSHRAEVQKPVVLLQHGLLCSAAEFLFQGPGKSLGQILADEGYDVWLGNARGNTFSRAHTHLSITSSEFWAFSFDDIADKDLPAIGNYIITATGAPSFAYVAHSQGTTVGLAALSSAGSFAQQVQVGVMLAPVAFAHHITSPVLLAMALLDSGQLFELLGLHEFLPSIEIVARFEGALCVIEPDMCDNFLTAIAGFNASNVDPQLLPRLLSYTPAGTSVQNMVHWSQAVRNPQRVMPKFDFGTQCRTWLGLPRACNQRKYGQVAPPQYNLTAITTPLALFTGGKDRLADPIDVEYLREALQPGVVVLGHEEAQYQHLDYDWGRDAHVVIYPLILDLLRGYAGKAVAQ